MIICRNSQFHDCHFFKLFSITLMRCDMFALRCYQCFFQVLLGNISVEIALAQY